MIINEQCQKLEDGWFHLRNLAWQGLKIRIISGQTVVKCLIASDMLVFGLQFSACHKTYISLLSNI